MKTWIKATAAGIAIAAVTTFAAHAEQPQSLRGATPLDADAKAAELPKHDTGALFGRAYRQQPPLVPHKIDTYQIDLKANQCIGCHDWPQNTAANAPKISETHYIGRTGERLNHVSTARWFCTQCHVPQEHVEALVPNEFKSAAELY
ncbi:MAG TPA: nitrate reductase cytochrome c-type subunit [Magnetovibrio sp.]